MPKNEPLGIPQNNPEDTPRQEGASGELETTADYLEPEKVEEPISETLKVGDVIVSKSSTIRKIKDIFENKDTHKKFFMFERIDKKGNKENEVLSFDRIDSKKDSIDYILTLDQQKRVPDELKVLEKEYISKGLGWDPNLHPRILQKEAERRIVERDLAEKRSQESGEK